MKIITTITRILVGALFIFSGFIKSNDPLGFAYKLDEYWEVFHIEWLVPFSLFLAISICVVEVILGFMLLLGSRKMLTLWLLLLTIVFFTFLTFYSWKYDVVKSCGCFGDAIPLTPFQSFIKDLILFVLIIILFIGRGYINPLFNPAIEKAMLVLVIAASTAFPLYTYNYLPVIDFRAYAIGENIQEGMKSIPDSTRYWYSFKNTKTNEVKEFDKWQSDTLTWKYDTFRVEILKKGLEAKIKDFNISSIEGEDKTETFLNYPGYSFWLVAWNLQKTNRGVQNKINDFAQLCEKDSVRFIGLTSNAPNEIKDFRHEVQAMYDYYITDGTVLKTMIRANPGLVLVKNGTVVAMWHYHSLPSYNEVKEKYLKK